MGYAQSSPPPPGEPNGSSSRALVSVPAGGSLTPFASQRSPVVGGRQLVVIDGIGSSHWGRVYSGEVAGSLTAQTIAVLLAFAAVKFAKCVIQEVRGVYFNPECMRDLKAEVNPVKNPSLWAAVALYSATNFGATAWLASNASALPRPVIYGIAMMAAYQVARLGAAVVQGISTCLASQSPEKYDSWTAKRLEMKCNQAYSALLSNPNISSVMMPLVTNLAMIPIVGWGATRAQSAILRGRTLGPAIIQRIGPRLVLRFSGSLVTMAATIGLTELTSYLIDPYLAELGKTFVNFDKLNQYLNLSMPRKFLFGSRIEYEVESERSNYGIEKTYTPKEAGVVTAATEEIYLQELTAWKKRNFTPAYFRDCNDREKIMVQSKRKSEEAFSISPCRWDRSFIDVIAAYAASHRAYRQTRLAEVHNIFLNWYDNYIMATLWFTKTQEFYDLVIRDLLTNRRKGLNEFSPDLLKRASAITGEFEFSVGDLALTSGSPELSDQPVISKKGYSALSEQPGFSAGGQFEPSLQERGAPVTYMPRLGQAKVPFMMDYLLTSMVCGPTEERVRKTYQVGRTNFFPPRVTVDDRIPDHLTFCDHDITNITKVAGPSYQDGAGEYSTNIYGNHLWTLNPVAYTLAQRGSKANSDGETKYLGLLDYLKNKINPNFLTPNESPKDDEIRAGAFQDWWMRAMREPAERMWAKLRAKYNSTLIATYLPLLSGELGFASCRDGSGYTYNLLNKYSAISRLWRPFKNVCYDPTTRIVDLDDFGQRPMRTARAIIPNLRDELKVYLETAEVLLVVSMKQSGAPSSDISDKKRAFRMQEKKVMDNFDLAARQIPGDLGFNFSRNDLGAELEAIYTMFNYSEDFDTFILNGQKAIAEAQLRGNGSSNQDKMVATGAFFLERERRRANMPESKRAAEDQKLTLATLFGAAMGLIGELKGLRQLTDGYNDNDQPITNIDGSPPN